MKKIANLLLFAVLIGTLSECKKGEDDPFISFRSRKARVVGEWTLTGGKSHSTYSYGNPATTTTTDYTYSETNYSRMTTTANQFTTTASSSSGFYYNKLNFMKNGEYTLVRQTGSSVYSESGVWNFTKGVGEQKNKEQIALTPRVIDGSSITNTKDVSYTFNLKELRNRTMVIVTEHSDSETTSDQFGSSTTSSTYTDEMTYERPKEKKK